MGNVFSIIRNKYNSLTSGNSSSKDIAEEVDKIATQYILTQDAIELLKLKDTKYYDNLVILTRDVLLKHLNSKELSYLYEYKKNGEKFEEMKKTNVIALNKNNLDEYDVKNKTQKKRMAYAIAKYYVKIAHVYAAIASTIDPEYKYTETDGSEKSFHLHDFDNLANIPVDALSSLKVQSLNNPMALCKKRLDTLMNKFDLNSKSDIIINPGEKFCNMNYDTELNDSKVLSKEPGIETLDKLYNDVYNTETGAWDKRSPKMEQEFNKDLKLFHETFTAKSQMPEDIKSFSDIKLIDFHTLPGCKDENSEYRKDYTGHVNDPLFYKYANTIKKMIRESEQGKNKLLKILKKLFITKEIEIEEYDEDSDIENEEELNNEEQNEEQNEEETMNAPIMEDANSDMSSENEDESDAEKTESIPENNYEGVSDDEKTESIPKNNLEDESDAEENEKVAENNVEDESDAEENENNVEDESDAEENENNVEGVSNDQETESIPENNVEDESNAEETENYVEDESNAEETENNVGDESDAEETENNIEGVSDNQETETIQDNNSTVETSEAPVESIKPSVESPDAPVENSENSSENSDKDESKSKNMFDNILSTFNINNKSETQTNKDVEENKDNSFKPLTGGKEASPSVYIKKTVVINPKITDKKLLSIANEARKEILKLYINCEKNFFEALLIYEAIVRTKLVARTTSRLEKAKGLLQKMITTKNLSSEDIIKLKKTLLNTSDELNEEEKLSMKSKNSEKNEEQQDESKKMEEEADEQDEGKRMEEEADKEAERKRMEEEAIAEAERKRIEAEEATAEAERKRIEAEEATAEAERKRKQEEEAMEEAERKRKQEEEAMEEAKRKREEAETNTDSSIMNDDDTKTPENAFSSSTQGNESEGMEANGMEANETQANGMEANETQDNETQANGIEANETPANEMQGNETQANEMQGNETQDNETQANETQDNGMEANETQDNGMQGNEMQGNEMQGNEMQGNETQGNGMEANQMPGNETPAMPAENSSENNENEEYFAKLLGDEKSNDNEMNTSKESPPTDTEMDSKIGGGGLNDIKMLKHLGGGLIGGDPFIDNFIKGFKKLTRKRHKKKRSKTKTVHGKSKKKNKKKKINVKKTSKNKK